MRHLLSNLRGLITPSGPRSYRRVGNAHVQLPAGALLCADGDVTVHCTRGTLWVTQTGDSRDHVLRPGDRWVRAAGGGQAVIQTLTAAGVTIRGKVGGAVSHILQAPTRRRASADAVPSRPAKTRATTAANFRPRPGVVS